MSRAPVADPATPRWPTSGWMRSELEALGVANRGTEWTDKQLATALRERGYDIRDGAPDSTGRGER